MEMKKNIGPSRKIDREGVQAESDESDPEAEVDA